jgi:hypothetical protein
LKELELLFGPVQVVDDTEKKKHACRYIDLNTMDLWEAIPEFDVTKTFDEFKSAVFKFYPGSESERKWTIADMDKLIGEQLQMGILDVSVLPASTETRIPSMLWIQISSDTSACHL